MMGREAPVVAIYGNVPLPRAVRLVEAFRAKYPTGKRGFRCRIVYGDEVTVYRTEKGIIVVRGGSQVSAHFDLEECVDAARCRDRCGPPPALQLSYPQLISRIPENQR